MPTRSMMPLGSMTVDQVLVNNLPLFAHCVCTVEQLPWLGLWRARRLTVAVDREAWSVLIAHTLFGASEDGSLTTWQLLRAQQPTVCWQAYLYGCTLRGTETQILVIVDLALA